MYDYTGLQISKNFLTQEDKHVFQCILIAEFKSVARFPPSGQISEIFDVGSIAYN